MGGGPSKQAMLADDHGGVASAVRNCVDVRDISRRFLCQLTSMTSSVLFSQFTVVAFHQIPIKVSVKIESVPKYAISAMFWVIKSAKRRVVLFWKVGKICTLLKVGKGKVKASWAKRRRKKGICDCLPCLRSTLKVFLAWNWFIRRSLEYSKKQVQNMLKFGSRGQHSKNGRVGNEAKRFEIEASLSGKNGKNWLMTIDHCLIKSMYPTHACVRIHAWNQDMDRIIKSRWNSNVGPTYDQTIRKKGIGMNGPDDPYIRVRTLEVIQKKYWMDNKGLNR